MLVVIVEMNNVDKTYKALLEYVLEKGKLKQNRTGIDTLSVFGYTARYNFKEGFPIITTKKVNFKNVWSELLWFIKGDTNIKFLVENNNHIWTEWAFENWIKNDPYFDTAEEHQAFRKTSLDKGLNYRLVDEEYRLVYLDYLDYFKEKIKEDETFASIYGNLGAVYGKQWRDFDGVDQLREVIRQLKEEPHSRRIVLSAWQPKEIKYMALPPCHTLIIFNIENGRLNCHLTQRSCDLFLGCPYNITSYALLMYLLAYHCDLKVGEFVHTIADAHIYVNHLKQVEQQLKRQGFPLPHVEILADPEKALWDYEVDEVALVNYQSDPYIRGEVAV